MQRLTLALLAVVVLELAHAQMTFTDNWQKKAFIPHVYRPPQQQAAVAGNAPGATFRGQKKSDAAGFDCSPEAITERMNEVRQLLILHAELAQQLATCARINSPFVSQSAGSMENPASAP